MGPLVIRSGLFRRFALVLGGLALVPVGLLGFHLISTSRRGIEAAVLELHTKLAENMSERIDAALVAQDRSLGFALASLQKPMDWEDKQSLLRSLIETDRTLDEISLVSAGGVERLKLYNPDLPGEHPMVSRASEPAYLEFRKAKRATARVVRRPGAPAVVAYYPMTSAAARESGVAARVERSLAALAEAVEEERVGGTGFAVVVDGEGQPLMYSRKRLDDSEAARFSELPIVKTALQATSVGSSEFETPWASYVGAYAPVASLGGAVIVLQPTDEAYRAAAQMKRAAAAVLVVVFALCAAAATLLARRLTDPLLALARAAGAVARGDFTAQVKLRTGDELEEFGATFNDMSDKLRRYAELQVDRIIAEQRKTEAILFSIADGIMMLDEEGRVQLANKRSLELLGHGASVDAVGKPYLDLVPEGKLLDAFHELLASAKWDVVKDLDLSSEQHAKFLRLASRPVVTPKGESVGVLIALRDVTLERELERVKEEFLHYVTHDLRNPLGSAMGFLDILLRGTAGVLNPDQYGIVSSVKRSTMRLMGMVNNILDIAKMESGRIRLQLKTTSLAGLAGRAIGILESLAKAKGIAVELSAGEEFSLECDADLLERVVTNLLGNAIKYTPEGGRITVSIVDEGDKLKLCVADTGEGIPPEYLERVFGKFEQVQGQRRGGTGLGLTIARFFVESHLGRIWVESELGKGSQFYFTVPKNLALDSEGKAVVGAAVA